MATSTRRPLVILGIALLVTIVCLLVGRNSSPNSLKSDPLGRHQLSVNSGDSTSDSVNKGEEDDPEVMIPFLSLIPQPPTRSQTKPPTQSQTKPPTPDTRPVSTSPSLASPTNSSLPSFHFSKDLFVRAVYFDSRPRDGHQNTSVFLLVCIKNITDESLIVGCQVDGVAARDFSVTLIGETPLWRAFYNYINHEEVLVHCYDLPGRNGSAGHIAYRRNKVAEVVTLAASERPLFIPTPRITPSSEEGMRYNMTIVTCAKIFNHPPWLKQWLIYQKTLGVDHVHLDAEDSFIKNGEINKPFIHEMIKEGFLSIDIWKRYLSGAEIWYHNQGLIYEDCPYRFRGTYDYIVMVDTDDFFTPRIPAEKKLHYYINRHCRGQYIGSCKFKWVEYYPDTYGVDKNVSTEDGNVTRALKSYTHYNQGNPKSLHRTTVLIDTATHYAYKMMPGYTIVNVPVSEAYVAHVRLYKKAGDGLVQGVPNTCSEHVLSKLLLLATLNFVFISPCVLCVDMNRFF